MLLLACDGEKLLLHSLILLRPPMNTDAAGYVLRDRNGDVVTSGTANQSSQAGTAVVGLHIMCIIAVKMASLVVRHMLLVQGKHIFTAECSRTSPFLWFHDHEDELHFKRQRKTIVLQQNAACHVSCRFAR